MLTKRTVQFRLEAFQGSEYDLWSSGGGGPSKIRPSTEECRKYWPGHSGDHTRTVALCAQKARELNFEFPNPLARNIIVDTDSPQFPKVVEWLTELSDKKLLYPDSGLLKVGLIDSPQHPYEWFEWKPRRWIDHFLIDTGKKFDSLSCKASAALPDVKMGHSFGGIFVLDEVKALIDRHDLTGVEFIWAKDVGRYYAPQWFWMVPKVCMGRGLDHPFFDFRKRVKPYVSDSPEWRFGVTWFGQNELKNESPFESAFHDQFVSLFHPGELKFATYRQYLRRDVPEADFAFTREIRPADLCFRRQVRDLFVTNGVIEERDCSPILVVDKVSREEETPYAFGRTELPYSMGFTASEMEELRTARPAAYQHLLSHPKPARAATIKNSLSMLDKARKKDASFFKKPATKEALTTLDKAEPVPVPALWREVLAVSDGFFLANKVGYRVRSAEDLVSGQNIFWHPEVADAATRYLTIDQGEDSAAFHSLDLATLNPNGDCHVHEFECEDLIDPVRVWTGIAEFIEEMLLDAEDEQKKNVAEFEDPELE